MFNISKFLNLLKKNSTKTIRFNSTQAPTSWIYGQKSQLYNVELANVSLYY